MHKTKEQKQLALRFSAATPTYDRAAKVQPLVVEKVYEMLAGIEPPGRILEIGCGTGMLTRKLGVRFPSAVIDAVDISDAMIARLRFSMSGNRQVRFMISDMRQIPESVVYPLIVSCSAIHWVSPIDEAMQKLSRLLDRNGLLVLGLMVEGTLSELRAARLRAAPHKPPLGRLPSSARVRAALRRAGLNILDEHEENIRAHYPSAAALLRGIHDQGATGGNVSLAAKPLNRNELEKLIMDYDTTYGNGKGVYATYCVAYFEVST